jgi:hypothetical protein
MASPFLNKVVCANGDTVVLVQSNAGDAYRIVTHFAVPNVINGYEYLRSQTDWLYDYRDACAAFEALTARAAG